MKSAFLIEREHAQAGFVGHDLLSFKQSWQLLLPGDGKLVYGMIWEVECIV